MQASPPDHQPYVRNVPRANTNKTPKLMRYAAIWISNHRKLIGLTPCSDAPLDILPLTMHLGDISCRYVTDVHSVCSAGDVETPPHDRLRDQTGLSEGTCEFYADQFRADLPCPRETRKRKDGAAG